MIRRFDPPLHRKGTLEHVRTVMLQWAQARAAGGPMFVYAIRARHGPLAGGVELRRITPECGNVSYWSMRHSQAWVTPRVACGFIATPRARSRGSSSLRRT
jgi:hypothetical protein